MKFFNNLTSLQKSLVISILSIVVFIVSTGASYSIFAKTGASSVGDSYIPTASSSVDEDDNEPKTEKCPLNGSLKSKKARAAWEQRRPLAVMIENHQEARPQSGISYADVVYEAVAEGGITRFMAVFYCNLADAQVGPVRSARTYFLDWVSEYDALYAHVGGANTPGPADALSQIITYNIKDLNQFSIGFPTFWRDYQRLGHPVATEHTMYSTTQKLWEIGAKRGWAATDTTGAKWDDKFVAWQFKDDAKSIDGTDAVKITVPFWDSQPDYTVTWLYDQTCGCYNRSHSEGPHLDKDRTKNAQLSAKNVVVQLQTQRNANDGYENNLHMLYGTIGQGDALIFIDGKVIIGKWTKKSRTARTIFSDAKGAEISFDPGLIWVQTVPIGSKVVY